MPVGLIFASQAGNPSSHKNVQQHIMTYRYFVLSSLLLLVSWLFNSHCQRERFTTNAADQVEFSTDTLRFDTVFTQLGSATRILKIYNPHNESIRISNIALEEGARSRFNLNVDGLPLGKFSGPWEIAPKDSMYVFAEVTINPNQPASASPFVITEKIRFETNGNEQKVTLEAWGQNAVYLPSRFGRNRFTGYSCNGGEWVWDDPRPYVVYGVLVIDDCTVRIPPGTRVYVHGGLGRQLINDTIVRYNDGFLAFVGRGKLLVEGTQERPVIFEDDRIEPEFADQPGQWTGIWLQSGTRGHRIDHCIIRNSIIGVRVDSAADLRIKNSRIYNTSNSGIIGLHANIEAENCLIYNNGLGIQLEYGGNYRFDYCTVASYGRDAAALKMGNALCQNADCSSYRLNRLQARLRNCIFYGSRADQVSLFNRLTDNSQFDYRLENCIVRVRELTKAGAYPDFLDFCKPCLNLESRDTLFRSPDKEDFRLDSLRSKADGYARPIPGIERDLPGKTRNAVKPDAGCFENL